jgi:replicative DNA helicase
MRTLPSNEDAERFVLGSVLLDEAFFDQAGTLEPDDFTLEKHRRIFKRMGQIHARGEKIDRVTVANELAKFHELDACDGFSYLVSLDDGLPQIPSIENYVRILKEKTILRRLIATAQHTINRCELGEEPPAEILAGVEEEFLKLGESHVKTPYFTASDLVAGVLKMAEQREQRWRETGNAVIGIESGIRRLDELLNGFNPGLYLLGAGPGFGKTSLSLQFAVRACQRGIPAVYVTYENSPQNLVLKAICAWAGVSPLDIEQGAAHADDQRKFRAASRELEPMILPRLSIIQGSMSLQLTEVRAKVIDTLRTQNANTCLVIFDYLQRAAPALGQNEMRTNVSALAGHLRDLANHLGCPVLALSSLNRAQGNYGSGRGSANLDSLKESGDLEYGADVVMFLQTSEQRQPNDAQVRALDLTISKNRFGPLGSVALIFRAHIGDFREEEQSRAERFPTKNAK